MTTPPLSPLPTEEARKESKRLIREQIAAKIPNGSRHQFDVIVIGMSIVGAAALFSLVALAVMVEDKSTVITTGLSIFTLIGTITATIMAAQAKLQGQKTDVKVETVERTVDGRMDELLKQTEEIAGVLAVRKERKEVAERAATEPIVPVTSHVEEMTVETLKVEKQVKK